MVSNVQQMIRAKSYIPSEHHTPQEHNIFNENKNSETNVYVY